MVFLNIKRCIYAFTIKSVLIAFQRVPPVVKRKRFFKVFAVLQVLAEGKTEVNLIVYGCGRGSFMVPHLLAFI